MLVNAALIAYSIWLFLRIIQLPEKFTQHSRSLITLNSGILLYYAATFVLFLAFEFLLSEAFKQTLPIWFCYTLLIFILHLFMLRSLWDWRRG